MHPSRRGLPQRTGRGARKGEGRERRAREEPTAGAPAVDAPCRLRAATPAELPPRPPRQRARGSEPRERYQQRERRGGHHGEELKAQHDHRQPPGRAVGVEDEHMTARGNRPSTARPNAPAPLVVRARARRLYVWGKTITRRAESRHTYHYVVRLNTVTPLARRPAPPRPTARRAAAGEGRTPGFRPARAAQRSAAARDGGAARARPRGRLRCGRGRARQRLCRCAVATEAGRTRG